MISWNFAIKASVSLLEPYVIYQQITAVYKLYSCLVPTASDLAFQASAKKYNQILHQTILYSVRYCNLSLNHHIK